MIKEINLDGIYVAPFAGYLFFALIIFIPVRMLFDRFAIQRWVWHRALFDASVFVIILSLIGLIFSSALILMSIHYLSGIDHAKQRRYLITGVTVLLAALLAWALWWHYLRAPWTR